MKSINNKVILFLCIVLICLFPLSNVYAYSLEKEDSNNKDVELYITGSECLPDHLRKTTDSISEIENKEKNTSLNLQGLNDLNISGSSQFSYTGLDSIVKYINGNYDIIDIDLRQEAHGFINGAPINWPRTPSKADSNLKEIITLEKEKLDSIKIDEPLTYYNLPCKTVIPKVVSNEETFIKERNLTYVRFPVIDGSLPTEKTVNRFIEFVNNQPKNSWLHFHCKEGVGRTTTFMIMYDIMKNAKNVSLDEIIYRQILLSKMDSDEEKGFKSYERIEFLTKFYDKFK